MRVDHGNSSLWHSTTIVEAHLSVVVIDVSWLEEHQQGSTLVSRSRGVSENSTDLDHLLAVDKLDSHDVDDIYEGVTVKRRHGNPIFSCDLTMTMFDVVEECLNN